MVLKKFSSMVVMICAMQIAVFAHLDKTSLSIKGGEKFHYYDTVTIIWKLAVFHNVNDKISFSSDSGKTWTLIDSVAEKSGIMQMSCKWIVPAITSTKARIRVFQTAISQPATTTSDYTLISPVFSIEKPVTAIIPIKSELSTGINSLKNVAGSSSYCNLNGRKLTCSSKKQIQIFNQKIQLYY